MGQTWQRLTGSVRDACGRSDLGRPPTVAAHPRDAGEAEACRRAKSFGRSIARGGLALPAAGYCAIAASAIAQPAKAEFCGGTSIEWSTDMAQSATDRLGNAVTFGQPKATLDYSNDLFAISLLRRAERTGNTALRDYGENIVGSFVAADGSIKQIPENGFRLDAMPAGLVRDKVVRDDQGRWSLTSIVRSAGLGPPPAVWPPGSAPSRRDSMPGGRDGSFEYYVEQPVVTDNPHGLGPFILAGIELDKPAFATRAGGPAQSDAGCRFPRK